MAIQVTNARIVPEIAYNKVHMENFNLRLDGTDDVKFILEVDIVLYAEIDGKKRFDETSRMKIETDDFEQLAILRASEGNTKLIESMGMFYQSVALLLESELDVGEATVL